MTADELDASCRTYIALQTGVETVIHGPENAWQSIGTLPTTDGAAMGSMDVMAMCNINMMFMPVAVFICLFISNDFRSGCAKNLFTIRVKKGDYVIFKTLAGFVCGTLMLIAYFIGAMLGGAINFKTEVDISTSLEYNTKVEFSTFVDLRKENKCYDRQI